MSCYIPPGLSPSSLCLNLCSTCPTKSFQSLSKPLTLSPCFQSHTVKGRRGLMDNDRQWCDSGYCLVLDEHLLFKMRRIQSTAYHNSVFMGITAYRKEWIKYYFAIIGSLLLMHYICQGGYLFSPLCFRPFICSSVCSIILQSFVSCQSLSHGTQSRLCSGILSYADVS